MSNLVERLHAAEHHRNSYHEALHGEAADEIERLRGELIEEEQVREMMSDSVRRLTMANKQLTKMCDQYLAELAAERQRSKVMREALTPFVEAYERAQRRDSWAASYLNNNAWLKAFDALASSSPLPSGETAGSYRDQTNE